ncbi:MAG: amidohydrolase family protein [Clostridiales Family XIII bacterium]|jgi:5-methylthioadenosine/S-adenosylhomocysteine deaminase|nr:amidohydrolase family protein [Clostridiales Family XIII bacterium]
MRKFDLIADNAVIISPHTNYKPQIGAVCVKDTQIVKVGPGNFLPSDAIEYIDAKGKILMPGLINGHCHGDMAFAKGLGDGMTLLEQIDAFRDHNWYLDCIEDEDRYWARILTYAESLLAGVTCITENMYWSLSSAQDAARETGIRAALAEDICRDFANPEELISDDEIAAFIEKCDAAGMHPVLRIVSEEDFSNDLLAAVARKTASHPCRTTCHIGETTWRIKASLDRTGLFPIEALDRYGLINDHFIGSHGVWLEPSEIDILAKRGAHIVNTPICELKIADGLAPIPALLEAGVNVSLGTDGALWNNSNDLFREMKCMAVAHNQPNNPRAIDFRRILDMATINGAKTLGLENEIGSIEVGKQADFILIDADRPHMQPLRTEGERENVASSVVFCATGRDVHSVFAGGKCLVREGELLYEDTGKAIENVLRISKRVASQ